MRNAILALALAACGGSTTDPPLEHDCGTYTCTAPLVCGDNACVAADPPPEQGTTTSGSTSGGTTTGSSTTGARTLDAGVGTTTTTTTGGSTTGTTTSSSTTTGGTRPECVPDGTPACAAGQTCVSGQCVTPGTTGGSTGGTGATPDAGACVAEGAYYTTSEDAASCCAGLTTVYEDPGQSGFGDWACLACIGPFQSGCATSADCCPGETCQNVGAPVGSHISQCSG